jgi:hypothetical protein
VILPIKSEEEEEEEEDGKKNSTLQLLLYKTIPTPTSKLGQ